MYMCTKSWSPHHRSLIYLVKNSPIACLPHSNQRKTNSEVEAAWKNIASKLCLSTRKCKLQWKKIQMRYAKLMILINTGKVTMDVAMSYPESSKYLDGQLSFLDPYLGNITDEDIPYLSHKFINGIFGLETKRETSVANKCHFITHAQVKALLTERELKGDVVNNIDKEYLQVIVDRAVERKLGDLLIMKNASSNPSNDIANNNDDENTLNLTMMPSITEQIVHNRNPSCTLIPSKNNQYNNEENTTRAINLGLQTELILDDDIKIEKEDNIKIENEEFVDIKNEDFVHSQNEQCLAMKEDNLTLEKNMNNTTEINGDIENNLPRSIIVPVEKMKNVSGDVHENLIVIENITDAMMDTKPVSDEYIRNFFNELGVVMSMELSLDKQKLLKSRINELLKSVLLK